MPVEKFSISLPADLVADLDRIADVKRLTRSAVIREATASYVTDLGVAARQSARHARIDRAVAGFEHMADRWGPDEHTGLHYLHELRGEADLASTEFSDESG